MKAYEKIVFLTILMTIFLSTDAYAQGVISRPTKSNNTKINPSKSNNAATKPSKPSSNTKKEEVKKLTGIINGHEWVDLGLPSGLKWATCNVGANSPGEYGNYYAWGETRPKSDYNWSNCFDCLDSSGDRWGTYKMGGKTQISPTSGHDTARENWGGNWRMPTNAELDELVSQCKWEWTNKNGYEGYAVTGPNGNSMFLPVAGMRYDRALSNGSGSGCYWSSTLSSSESNSASYLGLSNCNQFMNYYNRRCGFSVRPVTE